MDNFSTIFFLNCLLGVGIASLIFIIPGISIQYLLGTITTIRNSSALFFAPILGMSIYGPVSLVFVYLFDCSFHSLIFVILGFNIVILIVIRRYHCISDEYLKQIPYIYVCLFFFCAAFFAVLITIHIYPLISEDALFINGMIFDHAKCAIIDAIGREGLQPSNPYFTPFGKSLPLNYYYQWYFLASQLKILVGLSGWQADIVMTWFTAFASVCLIIGITLQISKPRAGIFAIILLLTSPMYSTLCWIFGTRFQKIFCIAPLRNLEPVWLQLSWAPQHVFSALSIILILFLCSRILSRSTPVLSYGAIIGLCVASSAGSSIWVGGIALALTAPVIIVILVLAKIPKESMFRLIKTSIIALPWCFIFFWPILSSITGVPSGSPESKFPVALALLSSTNLIQRGTWVSNVIHLIMFWLQLLPLSLGVMFIAGLPALFIKISKNRQEQYLRQLMIGATIGFLLVSQFFKSVVLNNDLGWRAVIVPELILIIWASVMMSDLIYAKDPVKYEWRFSSILFRWRGFLSIITAILLTIGLLSFICTYHFPIPAAQVDENTLNIRRRFLLQKEAWEIVRKHVKIDEIVQSNPDGYKEVTPWPANLPFALFADRRSAFASPEFVYAYAHNFDDGLRNSRYKLIQNIFSQHPDIESIHKIREELNIKALLIDQFDDVWNSTQIEDSGIYRKIYSDKNFKIYIANE